MTEAQVLQWKELGVPDVESLIAKGYQFCVQYSEGGKPYGEPLCFKTVDDISSFMRTYPNMKIIWQRKLTDHLEILTDRPHTQLPNYDSWGEDA